MDRYGQDWFLLCEGVCDCYGKWIDVFCAYTDTDFLPLTRYTIPNKIVGRDLSTENNDTYFSSAFVLSEPFICHRYHVMQSKYTNKNLKRYYHFMSQILIYILLVSMSIGAGCRTPFPLAWMLA